MTVGSILCVACLCTCYPIQLEALPIHPYGSWPLAWHTKNSPPISPRALWPTPGQPQMHETNALFVQKGNTPQQCATSMTDSDAADNKKSISIVEFTSGTVKVIKPSLLPGLKWALNTTSGTGFPEEFTRGIGISSGPPPQKTDGPYQVENKAAWANQYGVFDNTDAIANANKALVKKIWELQLNGRVTAVIEVDGLYEGCKEKSYIIDFTSQTASEHTIGEELRAEFFQDTYMYYGPWQTITAGFDDKKQCGGAADFPDDTPPPTGSPLVNNFRELGIGFGAGANGNTGISTIRLGNLCAFPKPTYEEDYPNACSVSTSSNTMWAATDAPLYTHGTPKC